MLAAESAFRYVVSRSARRERFPFTASDSRSLHLSTREEAPASMDFSSYRGSRPQGTALQSLAEERKREIAARMREAVVVHFGPTESMVRWCALDEADSLETDELVIQVDAGNLSVEDLAKREMALYESFVDCISVAEGQSIGLSVHALKRLPRVETRC